MSRTNKTAQESPSKRLRNTFYAIFEKDNEGFESFDLYYESKIEKLITHYNKFR